MQGDVFPGCKGGESAPVTRFNKPAALTTILIVACQGVLAHLFGVIWLLGGKRGLSKQLRAGKNFSHIVEPPGQLIASRAGSRFRIFARPVTDDGARVTGHYSFRNLGGERTEMHARQAAKEGRDLCSLIFAVFHADAA